MTAGYVEQTNSLISELTVAEMLMYTAELKRDPREPLKVRADCPKAATSSGNLKTQPTTTGSAIAASKTCDRLGGVGVCSHAVSQRTCQVVYALRGDKG